MLKKFSVKQLFSTRDGCSEESFIKSECGEAVRNKK